MNSQDIIHVAVAESSSIVRGGLVAILKRLGDLNVQPIEISSKEGLLHCMEAHQPDILIVNPQFEGWFDLDGFRQRYSCPDIKFVSLIYTLVDANQLKGYDESVNLFDDVESLTHKISVLMDVADEEEGDISSLSQREKEIVAVHFRAYGHHPQEEHHPEAADSFGGGTDHLCHREQACGTERGEDESLSRAIPGMDLKYQHVGIDQKVRKSYLCSVSHMKLRKPQK